MYLEKLRIFGFKSFAYRVEVNFPKDGITSIVGPNGCGKSNIVDAIRWVMGEQKVKQLRSTKMEDVIFSGTANRPPMNMAEVSLIVNNDEGLLPSEYSQVMITRQVYRSGESIYLLNNQPCRLKDIHNLFYDTGMGATSYSLMESKMIDSILSDKDEDRRVLFEEACGISKYKKQRQETKRQLERTALDLSRVDDNLRHTRQNVALFERQAKKAEEWKNVRQQYRLMDLSYHRDKHKELSAKKNQVQKQLGEIRHLVGSLESEITLKETLIDEKKIGLIEKERLYTAHNQQVANTKSDVVQVEGEMQRSKDRIAMLEDSIRRKDKDKDVSLQKILEYQKEKIDLTQSLTEWVPAKEALEQKISAQGAIHLQMQADQEEKRKELSTLNDQRVALFQQLSEVKNEKKALDREIEFLESQIREYSQSEDHLETEIEDLNWLLEEQKGQVNISKVNLDKLSKDLENKTFKYNELKEQIVREREIYHQVEKERVASDSRYQILKKMYESLQGVGKGAQHLLKNHREKIASVLFDQLKVSPEWMSLVENCLESSLQTMVVQGEFNLKSLLKELQDQEEGQGLFFDSRQSHQFTRDRASLNFSGTGEFQGWLIDKITFEDELKPLLEYLIGNYCITSSYDNSVKIANAHQGVDVWFVSQDGSRIHGCGLVRAGATVEGQQGLLQQKMEMETSKTLLGEFEAKSLVHKETLVNWERDLQEYELQLRQGADSKIKLQKELYQAENQVETLSEKIKSAHARGEKQAEKKSLLTAKLAEQQEELEPLATHLAQVEAEVNILEQAISAKKAELNQVENAYQDQYHHLREMENEKASIHQQIESATQRLQFLEDSEEEQSSMQLKMDLDEKEWSSLIATSSEKIATLQSQVEKLHQRLDGEIALRDESKSIYDHDLSVIDEMRESVKSLQSTLHSQLQKIHSLEIQDQQVQAQMQSIQERMFEIHEVDIAQESLEFESYEYQPEEVEAQISELKDKLKQLGNINLGAVEEYETEKKRLDDVQKQFDDLKRAQDGLEKAIRKLDKVAREQFLETFQQIQKNFSEVFTTLFEGGQAFLTLEEGVDPLDAKLIINASPSGKKMRGVTLLSGGERALTAISLLFALYLVRPSPYCIMDEVDGPLDDANIGRFVNLLRRFSNRCQFLVVTHNKRTMAASDMLYGVTQEVKGISQLASVRLDEASLIAG